MLVRRSLVRAQVEEPLNARSGSEAASAHSDVADLNHPASDLAYLSPSPEPRLDWSLIAFSVVYFAVYLESVIWFIFA